MKTMFPRCPSGVIRYTATAQWWRGFDEIPIRYKSLPDD
jgi:hypothetical protein